MLEGSVVSAAYFRTLGIRLRRGRLFTAHDAPERGRVAVLDAGAARLLFGSAEPIGQRVQVAGFTDVEVVGVVEDTRHSAIESRSIPHVYLAMAQAPQSRAYILSRAGASWSASGALLRQVAARLDSAVPIDGMTSLSTLLAGALATPTFYTLVLGVLSVIALGLAAGGLMASLLEQARRKQRDIGIRLALGETPAGLVYSVLMRTTQIFGTGMAVGVLLMLPAQRLLSQALPGAHLETSTPVLLTLILTVLVLLAAAAVPTFRTARLNVATVIRA